MAYSNYGAFVFKDGKRRNDKEDVEALDGGYYHGVIGDGNIQVCCYKQGLPRILEKVGEDINTVECVDKNTIDIFEYPPIKFEYKGYKFYFESGKPHVARMTEPDGTEWECSYDYEYGAGFEEGFC